MSPSSSFSQALRDWVEVFMRRSFQDFKRFMDEANLSPSQVSAMMRLHHCGECGVTEIAEHLGFSKPAASQMVERLVRQGLLKRMENPNDRRVKQIALTREGQSLIEAGIDARQRWMEQLTTTLAPEEQQAIAEALILLTEAARRLESDSERRSLHDPG